MTPLTEQLDDDAEWQERLQRFRAWIREGMEDKAVSKPDRVTITIPAEHAARYRECGAVLFPMEPQPEMTLNDTGRFWQWDGPDIVVNWDSRFEDFPSEYAPFPPGYVIVFEWEEDRLSHDGFHPGQRIRRTVSSITAKRLGELTEDDAVSLGHERVDDRTAAKFSIPGPLYRLENYYNHVHPDHPWDADRWAWLVGLEEMSQDS